VTPAACRLPAAAGRPAALPAAARKVLASAGTSAVRTDFAASLERTMWFQVAVFLAGFALMLALPRGAGRRRRRPSLAGADRNAGAGASASNVVIG
jgi:hypothetical protein